MYEEYTSEEFLLDGDEDTEVGADAEEVEDEESEDETADVPETTDEEGL
jgi:hypothetical protein